MNKSIFLRTQADSFLKGKSVLFESLVNPQWIYKIIPGVSIAGIIATAAKAASLFVERAKSSVTRRF
jgi:hypothetical protein